MPSPAELDAAKNMLNAYRSNRVLAVTITYEEWKRATEGGLLKVRSSEFEAIDAALKEYHAKGKSEGELVKLRQAFDNWVRGQQRAGKIWTQSERNKSGIVSKLHEQLLLTEAGRSVKNMGNKEDWEARMAMINAEREALQTLFAGRKLIFKKPIKDNVGHLVEQYGKVATMQRAVGNIQKGSAGGITSEQVSNAFTTIGGDIPQHLANAFGCSAESLISACASVLSFGTAPVKLLNDIIQLGLATKARVQSGNARFAFAPGNADAALDAVIKLINHELALIGKDMVQHTGSIVATAFGAGPIASAANAAVDIIANAALYVQMLRRMDAGNRQLAMGRLSLDLFTESPLLGAYFLLMADTSMWVNFSVHDMGTDGFTKQIDTLVRRAEPVRDKAREYIRNTKYALSGSEGFNGLEWEPTWRNNKMAYLKAKMTGSGVGNAAIESYRVYG